MLFNVGQTNFAGNYSVVVTNVDGAVTSTVASLVIGATPVTILDNWNIQGVNSGPTIPTTFSIASPYWISVIRDYHFYNSGALPGTISLLNADGTLYGPWQAVAGEAVWGVTNSVWLVTPHSVIKPGNCTVIDSGNSTWSYNSNGGFSAVYGFPTNEPPSGATNPVVLLTGTNGYVTVPSSSDLQNPTQITVEAWIYPEPPLNGDNCFLISKSDGLEHYTQRTFEFVWVHAGGEWLTHGSPGIGFQLFLNASTWAFVGAPLPEMNWVHVAATYTSDTGLLQLYTNGVWAASTTNASDSTPLVGQTVRQTTLPLVFGGPTWDNKWGQGFIDEVRIWAMARTAQEIQATEFCRLTGLEANLAGYWNFDEGSANDLTGHGHNGIFVGNAHAVSIVGNDAVHAGVCGLPRTATASAVLTNAFVVSANITDGGYGYTNMPTVRIIGGGGSGAVAVAVVSNGVVVAVNILDAGSGYTNTPVIVIAPPFIPQPTMGIAVHLFGPMVTPVVQLDLASLSPYDNYQLELSSVAGGIWTNVGLPFIPTGSTSTQYFNGSGNVGFFRVKHLP